MVHEILVVHLDWKLSVRDFYALRSHMDTPFKSFNLTLNFRNHGYQSNPGDSVSGQIAGSYFLLYCLSIDCQNHKQAILR